VKYLIVLLSNLRPPLCIHTQTALTSHLPYLQHANTAAFPNRDFITLEGYQSRVGQKFLLQALRKGKLIGNAIGTIKAGDVAAEINHPGGTFAH
jgi:hypothetical protein